MAVSGFEFSCPRLEVKLLWWSGLDIHVVSCHTYEACDYVIVQS